MKNVKLGEGGFGKVFLGNIHGVKVGTKYIDVTKKYHMEFVSSTNDACMHNCPVSEVLPKLLGDVAFEATLQYGDTTSRLLPKNKTKGEQ